jgi:hypothetical protein
MKRFQSISRKIVSIQTFSKKYYINDKEDENATKSRDMLLIEVR